MKRLWALLIGMVLFGAILFYWAGEDGRKVPEFRKLDTIDKQITYTGGLVTALNLGYNGPRKEVEELEDMVIKSTEYMLSHFRDELEKRPTLHVRVLQDLAYQYGEYKQNHDKAEKYRQKYERIAENNKKLFLKGDIDREGDIDRIRLGAMEGRRSMYFDKKEYEKVVEENLKIIAQYPYGFSRVSNANTWVEAYDWIWHMYNDRIKDYDKALYYAKAMAIDPKKLPKEKIGWLGDQGKDYDVSYDCLLEIEAEANKRKSDYTVQITYGSFNRHKELQQLLVDSNKNYEKEYGCAYYNGMNAIEDLYKLYKHHGVFVTYDIKNIFIFYPDENSFGCALKIGDNKYKYTEVTSRVIFPEELEFLENGNIRIITESVLLKINEQNRKYKKPEITEEELTKGWKRETRIIDDKELNRLYKRVR